MLETCYFLKLKHFFDVCFIYYGFHSFLVVDWFCLFIYLWVLTFPLEDCSEFGNFVITLIYLYLFTHRCVQHDFHMRWCSRRLALIQWVSYVEQDLLTLSEHMSSPSGSSGARVVRSVVFCLMFRRSLFVILSSFCWTGVRRMHHILHEEENMYQFF